MLLLTAPAVADAASAKPRLLHGPQVYRLNPTEKYGDVRGISYTYAVVFQLSRVTIGPIIKGDFEAYDQAGMFSLAGVDLQNYTHDNLYTPSFRPQRCVVAYFDEDTGDARDRRKLDRLRIGQRVSVTLRPLASAIPNVSYGRTYHRKVTLRQGRRYTLLERGVQKQLRAIDCNRR